MMRRFRWFVDGPEDRSNDRFTAIERQLSEGRQAATGRARSLNGLHFDFIGHCLSGPIPIRTQYMKTIKAFNNPERAADCKRFQQTMSLRNEVLPFSQEEQRACVYASPFTLRTMTETCPKFRAQLSMDSTISQHKATGDRRRDARNAAPSPRSTSRPGLIQVNAFRLPQQ
jgi:hypothetical protein